MKTRHSLMFNCQQAQNLERIFRKANRDVLRAELTDLHAKCLGSVTSLAFETTVHCTCECHIQNPQPVQQLDKK